MQKVLALFDEGECMKKKFKVIIAIIIVCIVGFASYYVYKHNNKVNSEAIINPYESAWYYIDVDGNLASDTPFEYVHGFNNDGIACVVGYYGDDSDYKNVYGFIDNSFTFINDKYWDYDFLVEYGTARSLDLNYGNVLVRKSNTNDKLTVMDNDLNELKTVENLDLENSYHWVVSDDGVILVVTADGLYGYLDTDGEWLIEPEYTYAEPFKNGYAVARIDGKMGIIDEEGNWIVEPAYKRIIYDGYDAFFATESEDDAYRLFDLDNNRLNELLFDEIECYGFDGELCSKKDCDTGLWGFVNISGEYVIEPQYDDVHGFYNGVAVVIDNKSEKRAYIDKKGNFITDYIFDAANGFSKEGIASVEVDGKWGYIKSDGSWLLEPQFEDADSFSNGYAAVKLSEGQEIVK